MTRLISGFMKRSKFKEKKFYDHILKNELYLQNSVLLLNYGNRNVITIKVKFNKKVFIH